MKINFWLKQSYKNTWPNTVKVLVELIRICELNKILKIYRSVEFLKKDKVKN